MQWTVEWDDPALEDLADVWMNAVDPQAVRDAANHVDRELAVSPETKGQEFYGDRLIVVPPLQVVYKVDIDHKTATVLHLW